VRARRACITARTKEFARAGATSLRFLSNGETPLLSRTLRDYVHFLPLPREYLRTYVRTYVAPVPASTLSSEPAFYSGYARRALGSRRETPDAITGAASLERSFARDVDFFLFPRHSAHFTMYTDIPDDGKWERGSLRLAKSAVDLYLRG